MSPRSRTLALIGLAVATGVAGMLWQLRQPDPKPAPSDWKTGRFLGAQTCAECHSEYFESFQHTAHHLTSAHADASTILGSFEDGRNVLVTSNPDLHFEMETKDGEFYQTAIGGPEGEQTRRTRPIHIVTGSGKGGQSYLYWKGERLYQLPVSFLSTSSTWINSPGYKDGEANFVRRIFPRCLECHATYAEKLPAASNAYSRNGLVLGISCERCHGPGEQHVDYHRAHPTESSARFIVHPGELTVARQNELCMQCHSGGGTLKEAAFSYRPGQRLADHVDLPKLSEQNEIGVHSNNQLARLSLSECFQKSEGMTCTTCHNPHTNERGSLRVFSERCQSCHAEKPCGLAETRPLAELAENCIDCHLPIRRDRETRFHTGGTTIFPTMRDHAIAVIPEVANDDESVD